MIVLLSARSFLFAQAVDTITENNVSRIIQYLASDSLRGRGNGTPDIGKACSFITNEFSKNNLQPLPGFPYYTIPFRPFGGAVPDQLVWNGSDIPARQFHYLHRTPGFYPEKKLADFTVVKVNSFFEEGLFEKFSGDSSALLLWTDQPPPGATLFPEKMDMPAKGLQRDVLLVYADGAPATLSLTAVRSAYAATFYNVVAVLPGHSRPGEVIIFSAHYDHVGVAGRRGDTIFNGANDNASGSTALLLLAEYFSKRNDNARTIMFCAFAGEELGLFGSTDFVRLIDPAKIVAGINIEMIGVPQYGKNGLFILGERYSDLPRILARQFKTSRIAVRGEPDETKLLFQRSDNFPFAARGVPFHTIMTSDDEERCYHQPCDDMRRIDTAHMTRIIRGIAAAAQHLVNGSVTPKRISPSAVERDRKRKFVP